MWFRSVNCIQTTWAPAQLFKADYKYISVISMNDWVADGESLDLYLISIQKSYVYKEPVCFEGKTISEIKVDSEYFF